MCHYGGLYWYCDHTWCAILRWRCDDPRGALCPGPPDRVVRPDPERIKFRAEGTDRDYKWFTQCCSRDCCQAIIDALQELVTKEQESFEHFKHQYPVNDPRYKNLQDNVAEARKSLQDHVAFHNESCPKLFNKDIGKTHDMKKYSGEAFDENQRRLEKKGHVQVFEELHAVGKKGKPKPTNHRRPRFDGAQRNPKTPRQLAALQASGVAQAGAAEAGSATDRYGGPARITSDPAQQLPLYQPPGNAMARSAGASTGDQGLDDIFRRVEEGSELSVAELNSFYKKCDDLIARINDQRPLDDVDPHKQVETCIRRSKHAEILQQRITAIESHIVQQHTDNKPEDFGILGFITVRKIAHDAIRCLLNNIGDLYRWRTNQEKSKRDMMRAAIEAATKQTCDNNSPLSLSALSLGSGSSASPATGSTSRSSSTKPPPKRQQTGENQDRGNDKGKGPARDPGGGASGYGGGRGRGRA